ncbi:MAG TPA: branched-chain amino acid ABC transporter permease [Bacillota bacterium]|nr:branched-chain amino acid ABC transporter permease [Bacillota bacterium]HOH09895.1 branched-chain amino acid ABC transporter permease [Bacillota bacterium]HOY88191.1 branched-chain amino acid ABC transporter permease [Bacillota bacterium]HPI00692.1 branched-chain amino acid ABC transporter permease [Bacillota bacterium]HPM63408.1 branched-chain amino acid ABC transporter permease [Bacillota bacterium]
MSLSSLLVQVLIQGLAVGSVYALIALGYVMIFKAVGVFNFAQGDFMMSGCFIGLWLIVYLRLPIALGLILAVLLTSLLGILVEAVVFHPLLESPSRSYLISTVAVGIILREIGRLIFGADPLSFPNYLGDKVIKLGSVGIPVQYIWISLAAVAVVSLLLWFFKKTKMGKAMRAVSEDRETARLMGIDTNLNMKLTYALSSAMGAIAGVLIAPVFFAFTEMGRSFGQKAFSSFVLGGTDSIPGAVVGGLLIGVVENLAGVFISTKYKDAISFIILIVVLICKPRGLFGGRGERRAA